MHLALSLGAAAVVMLLPSSALAVPTAAPLTERTTAGTSTNQETINQLLLAATGHDRIVLLPNDNDFTYNFAEPPTTQGIATGLGGRTVTANRKTMPGLIGTGSSMTLGALGPCGMNTPHTHPRGTELNIVVEGSLVTSFILENDVRAVHNTLSLYQMAVFPHGALHMEFNPDCGNTTFVAAFNNEDAGTQQTANTLFKMNDNVLGASFGGETIIAGQDLDAVRDLIPLNVAKGVEECLQKCGLKKRSIDTASS